MRKGEWGSENRYHYKGLGFRVDYKGMKRDSVGTIIGIVIGIHPPNLPQAPVCNLQPASTSRITLKPSLNPGLYTNSH